MLHNNSLCLLSVGSSIELSFYHGYPVWLFFFQNHSAQGGTQDLYKGSPQPLDYSLASVCLSREATLITLSREHWQISSGQPLCHTVSAEKLLNQSPE